MRLDAFWGVAFWGVEFDLVAILMQEKGPV